MSPRPRRVSDNDILVAALRAIDRVGPQKLTLADVACEAGISAAALVQRFGSKRALLLAAAADVSTGSEFIFPGLRARHRSPVRALIGMAECMTLWGASPGAVANHLAFLQLDLTDPEFHRYARIASSGIRLGLKALVIDAIKAGELRRCHAGRLASALQATLNGSLIDWAVHREGDVVAWIRRDVETVLRPYRTRRRPT
jgi:AcrR family transcriptional regulator